jgi:hypothetical protein
LKRTLFRALWAVFPAFLLIQNARSQAAPSGDQGPAGQGVSSYKYEVYAGWGYTSLNQVNQSRYGLFGVELTATRDLGKYFGFSGFGNYYKPPLSFGGSNSQDTNPGDPSVYEVLAGPELHVNIYGPVSGFFHGGMGAEHTGGEGETPKLSFAGGFGGGMTYDIRPRIAIRAYGDKIGASFSLRNNTPELGNSPHRTWNSSGTVGIVYRF